MMKWLITICSILLLACFLGQYGLVQKRPQTGREYEHGHDNQPRPISRPEAIPLDESPVGESLAGERFVGEAPVGEMNARSSPPAVERDVSVSISGLADKSSNVFVAVYQSANGFPLPANSIKTVILPATEPLLELSLPLLEDHPIAIAIFQDLDGNGVLSKNAIGMPIEPYGFTNNIRPPFGPPTFDQSMIQVTSETRSLEIQLR